MMNLTTAVGVRVFWKLEAYNPKTGKTRQLTDTFENTLLTTGRNNMASQNWFQYCQIGTDGIDPDPAQDKLPGWFAGDSTIFGSILSGAAATPPYYGWKRKTFEFPALTGSNQILKEVGIGWADGSNPVAPGLTTRGLIVDINGDPATPVWVVGEILRVTAEVRFYPPLGDVTGTVTLAGTTYYYTLRAANVTSGAQWGSLIGNPIGVVNGTTDAWNAYPNNIEDITLEPTGTAYIANTTSQYNYAYSNGTYQRIMGCLTPYTGWNVPGGIRSLRYRTQAGAFQIQFGDAPGATGNTIPKTTSYTMFFSPIVSWAQGVLT